jgi:hypothetical protein
MVTVRPCEPDPVNLHVIIDYVSLFLAGRFALDPFVVGNYLIVFFEVLKMVLWEKLLIRIYNCVSCTFLCLSRAGWVAVTWTGCSGDLRDFC